jgi:acetyltransferase
VVATSGGMAHTLAFACARDGIGVATAVGLGNCVDVTAADVVEHLAADPAIRCIALHLENVQDGSHLLAAVENASVTTPIVALVVGRSDVDDFARSHTGALATSWRTTRSLLRQAGAVLVDDERELVDAAAGLSMVRLPAGSEGRTGLVTAQAGPGLLLTDALRTLGIPMPLLRQETVDRLGTLLPPMTYQRNPVDTGRPGATYQDVMLAVGEDPGVDLMTVFGLLEPDAIDLGAQVRKAAVAIGKPMVAVIAGLADEVRDVRRSVREAGVVGVDTPAAAVTVIDALRRDSRGQARLLRGGADEAPAVFVPERRPDEDNLKRGLAKAGVAVPRGCACRSEAEVRQVFEELGGPVVLKMLEPALAHKTEAGAVRLGLRTGAEVDRALAELRDIGAVRYLVEEMAPDGVELIVGARRDPVFGPVVMVGLGGTTAELIADVTIRAWPLRAGTAGEMVDELTLGQVLRGYRGGPSVDEASLHQLLTVLGGAVAADPSISSFEVNPARVRADGTLVALDASVITEKAAQNMTKGSLIHDSERVT